MKVFGQLEKAQLENTTSDTGSLPKGMITYRTDLNLPKVSNGTGMITLVDVSTAQTLTNKTLTAPVLNGAIIGDFIDFTQTATPATPAAGHNKLYFKNDKTLYTLDETGVESAVGSGGGGGSKNYLSTVNNINGNGNFELGTTTKWSLFNTTLTSKIPTGSITAGAASLTTFATTTSGKLAGGYSLSVAGSGVITAGHGFISDAVTFDLEDQVAVCSFEFSYKSVSGTMDFSGTSDNTWAVYIHDGTNWIQPAGVYGMDQGSGVGKVRGTFQTTGATAYRLAVICVTATGGAASMLFDSFKLGPQAIAQGTPVTDWQEYTPVFSNFGSATSRYAVWRRVGSEIEVKLFFTTGTVGAGTPSVTLPSGIVGVTHGSAGGNICAGFWIRGSSSTAHGGGVLITDNATSFTFGGQQTFGSGSLVALNSVTNASSEFNTGENISLEFKMQVAGWSSNVQMSADSDTRVVSFSASNEAGYTQTTNAANTVMSFAAGDVLNDTHGSWNAATNTWTCPVSGLYMIYMQGTVLAGSGVNRVYALRPKVNGTFFNIGLEYVPTGLSQTASGYRVISLKAGDQIVPEAIYDAAGTFTIGNCAFTMTRISGPSQVAANEAIVATADAPNGQAVSASTVTILNFDNVVLNTHGAITTGASWKFTAPSAGFYEVSARVNYGNTSGVNTVYRMSLYKNGSSFKTMARYVKPTGTFAPEVSGTSLIIRLNAGDYIDIRAENDEAATTNNAGYVSIKRMN